MRLSDRTLSLVRPPTSVPAYDRNAVTIGVVHFGPGAFHRAHQAFYFDRMLARDPTLGICAVSLRSAELRNAISVHYKTKPEPVYDDWFVARNLQKVN